MRERLFSVIMMAPEAPRTRQLNLSRGGVRILISTLLLALLAVIWIGRELPPPVDEARRMELKAENQALKMEASTAANRIKTLSAKLVELEEKSKKINDLMTPAD